MTYGYQSILRTRCRGRAMYKKKKDTTIAKRKDYAFGNP